MTDKKYVYFFGDGKAEGHGKMKDLLGGKGAGLAEMTNAGLNVPPGFTITTEACLLYYDHNKKLPDPIVEQIQAALQRLESLLDQRLGSAEKPLLVSVRSGAKLSMPGMMDTILNLGLNDETVKALARRVSDERFAYDCHRRLIQMFGNVVLNIEKSHFEEAIHSKKEALRVKLDTELSASALKDLIADFKRIIKQEKGSEFPQDPREQLRRAINAVFDSWYNPRAIKYREIHGIPETLGTAVTIQAMVFGNLGETSGSGVGFTRSPATGEKALYGEFLTNAQGEDVVAGIRTPLPVEKLREYLPEVDAQLRQISERLEKHYRDVQDFEFTVQEKKLYMLQTRTGKRTGPAAVKIAVDMVQEGLITKQEAVLRVEPVQLEQLLHPIIDPRAKVDVLATGLPASPGAAVGRAVFTANDAVEWSKRGEPVILVRNETSPDDIHGMNVARGILTARGGMTSHAAVVARGMGKCCVAGCEQISVSEKQKMFSVDNTQVREGDYISLDGTTGRVIKGKVSTIEPDPTSGIFATFMRFAEDLKKIGVRANADIPRDAEVARKYGAEGIGLCRTEHMFFAEDRLPFMQKMILATTKEARQEALAKLLPMQKADFMGLFKVMDGLPVIIRLLDPPLHEFLPKREELLTEVALMRERKEDPKKLAEKEKLLARVEELHEFNPMLGHRGCRLGITYPEISEMQARAIFEAACEVKKAGGHPIPEIMIPLVGMVAEFRAQKEIIDRIAKEVFASYKTELRYLVGTMIEVPRAALTASDIAKEAEFFSYGTNDLTQTTFGFSRDDAGKFIREYQRLGILQEDPFIILDREGVGELIRIGFERGRAARPDLEVGICGEHGGEPKSVVFCHNVGLDYVSCSPYRVPIAILAAAQAAVETKEEYTTA